MLSKENVEKLVKTGLYRCEPNKKYRAQMYWDNMYHCFNWTFRVVEHDEKYFMVDTYFNDTWIQLDDQNFDEFELIFDFTEVERYRDTHFYDYDEKDRWSVAIDSSGRNKMVNYIRKNAQPNKEKVLLRLREEIESAERNLAYKKDVYQRVVDGTIDLRYT